MHVARVVGYPEVFEPWTLAQYVLHPVVLVQSEISESFAHLTLLSRMYLLGFIRICQVVGADKTTVRDDV
jgi:hypothetical protein